MSDKGFYVLNDLKDCEEDGISVFMPIPTFNPTKNVGVPEPEFFSERFVYDSAKDFMSVLLGRSWGCGSAMSRASLSLAGVIERLVVLAVFSGAGALVTGWVE